ncbi:MAG: carbohydrate kinase family protein [Stomatobaculum sp.]|nr:carbohydrate kinase family protein [Stomatobaculum sp.]
MDVIVIGPVVMDITARTIAKQDTWKEKQRIEGIRLSTGGDAANQSIRLADLDRSVATVGCVGKDQAGMLAKTALQKRGVEISRMKESEDRETGSSLILVREDGERNIFSNKSAHEQIQKEDCAWIREATPKALSIASLFSVPYLEEDGLEELLRDCRSRGILTFADLASDKKHQGLDGIRRFLPYLDYFLPSEADALAMTCSSSPEEAAEVYLENGASCAVIKCAARGAYYSNGNECGWVPALPVEPVDTTGAGDCMAAHFIHHILNGLDLKEACRLACEAASLSTLQNGASLTKLHLPPI